MTLVEERDALVEERAAVEPLALEAWLDRHGPLSPRSALLLALRILGQASRMTHEELRRVIDSLGVPFVARGTQDDWHWIPEAGSVDATSISDADVIERIGVVLFTCLTGQPPAHAPTAADVRAAFRRSRTDLPAHLSEVVARMSTARMSATLTTFDAVADELSHLAAVEVRRPARWRRQQRWWGMALLTVAAAGWSVASTARPTNSGRDGLSRDALTTVAAANESVDRLALTDEHTAAFQLLKDEEKVLRQELAPDDPRLAWNTVRQAWIRILAADDITVEQLLFNKAEWFDAKLGPAHPYGRAARLMLASALSKRHAPEAGPLDAAATRAPLELLGDRARVKDLLPGIPTPSATFAHVAPNAPEREGFWRDDNGGYRALLTSTLLWIAGRDGWRLHIVAADECRATFMAGTNPRAITVTVSRAQGRWQAAVTGTQPALTLNGDNRDAVAISVIGDPAGVQLHMDDAAVTGALDATAIPPVPPYTLSFQGRTPDACRVVWAEVKLPRTGR